MVSSSLSLSVLAAWFRLKYPHIAIGALASSAPILQFDDITPWSSFYDAVSQDFKEASLNCYEVIKGSWAELEALSAQKEDSAFDTSMVRQNLDLSFGREDNPTSYLFNLIYQNNNELSRTFRACQDLHSLDSVWEWLWSAFVYTAMVNYPTDANFMMPLPAYPVQAMCKIIDGFPSGASKITRVFAAASLYYNYSRAEKCFKLEHEPDAHGLHGWDWQACTEMVMPMTCSEESMFPTSSFSYEEFSEDCMRTFGVKPRPHWITTEFGGKRIELVLKRSGGNIIFSNGMQDPWSRGGVLKNISSSIIALVTEKGAHHVDFRSATKDDPEWLKELRRQEVEIIQGWIDQYYPDLKRTNKE
ncbi:hypothetical protein NC651_038934 [Populus alba x Populus x berolinensis]|nr:hypothetical protein NC651_038934 [Populus alba x Populus x berolinensis]